uniref:Ig-like domain-containing protein n=1 Tax=uncultured Flavobacterium sp. TaxID=165435 RepID=UPI0030CA341B
DVLVNGTTYYASETLICESIARLAVTATVNAPVAVPVGAATQTFCLSANITQLAVTGLNVVFYDAAIGGNVLPLNAAVGLTNGATYYASSSDLGCESASRLAVTVVLDNPTAPSGDSVQVFCDSANMTQLVASGSNIQWYDTATDGTLLPNIASVGLVGGATYYASQTINGCEGTTRMPVLVQMTQPMAAIFAPVAPICSGTTAPTLSLTSSNGIAGTWLPSVVDNTASGTYAFTPDAGQCGFGTTLNVSVTASAATPTGDALQTISVPNGTDVVIEDLVVLPSSVVWYTTLADALAGTNPIAAGTVLTDGLTYYAVDESVACVSSPLAVTVTVVLGAEGFDNASFVAYPNPVNDMLNISYSSEISSVHVINLLGQVVASKNVGTNSTQIDMTDLAAGAYIVQVTVNDIVKTIKVIKN